MGGHDLTNVILENSQVSTDNLLDKNISKMRRTTTSSFGNQGRGSNRPLNPVNLAIANVTVTNLKTVRIKNKKA